MMKWIIGLLVVVAAGAALWWSGWLGVFGTTPTPVPQDQQAAAAPTQQATPTPQNDLPTALSDASDAALAQDWVAINIQLQKLSSDGATIDQSLNDKPGAQAF